jgi:hypothetical protein
VKPHIRKLVGDWWSVTRERSTITVRGFANACVEAAGACGRCRLMRTYHPSRAAGGSAWRPFYAVGLLKN